jgi:hypothetical protein
MTSSPALPASNWFLLSSDIIILNGLDFGGEKKKGEEKAAAYIYIYIYIIIIIISSGISHNVCV